MDSKIIISYYHYLHQIDGEELFEGEIGPGQVDTDPGRFAEGTHPPQLFLGSSYVCRGRRYTIIWIKRPKQINLLLCIPLAEWIVIQSKSWLEKRRQYRFLLTELPGA